MHIHGIEVTDKIQWSDYDINVQPFIVLFSKFSAIGIHVFKVLVRMFQDWHFLLPRDTAIHCSDSTHNDKWQISMILLLWSFPK